MSWEEARSVKDCDGREKTLMNQQILQSRRQRLLCLLACVSLLAVGAVALWTGIRTPAEEGVGVRWWENHPGKTETEGEVISPSLPAALPSGLLSPFRPREEETETTTDTATEAPTEESAAATTGRDEPIYRSHPNDRMEIALTFDDGPHPRLTPVILDILAEYGIRATFFMVGENVGYYHEAARAVVEAGHEVGNHTFSHRKFDRMGEEELLREISACESALSEVTDSPVRLIRPPEGQVSDTMRRVMGTLDYRVILWDVDTRDWAHTSPEEISRHILETVEAGDIILMHDFIGYNSPTPEALRRVIPALLERGFRFVTVGELVEGE